jgi:hypothetical protein
MVPTHLSSRVLDAAIELGYVLRDGEIEIGETNRGARDAVELTEDRLGMSGGAARHYD